jgi:hypothetical protein
MSGSTDPVVLYEYFLVIFCHVTENEAKENARVPLNPVRRSGIKGSRKPKA